MKVRDVMTKNPICAGPTTSVGALARLMSDANCGEVPICKDGRLVGVVTDRDVTCRIVARRLDAEATRAADIMTLLPVSVSADDSLSTAIDIMEQESIRRAPVVDATGTLVGILSQVDVAMRASYRKAGKMLAKPRPLPLAKL